MKARRLKEFEKELRARRMEIERAEIDLLSTMAVSQAVKVIRREVLTVMNAVLLQLERIDGGITFSCIEQTRQQAAPRKYERGIAPSRSTVQLAQKQINIAGQTTVLQDTKRSDDMCAFSLRRVLCELLPCQNGPDTRSAATAVQSMCPHCQRLKLTGPQMEPNCRTRRE